MASLIEDLISTLDEENTQYEILLQLSKEKTPIIVKGDIEELKKMVEKEQIHTDLLAGLEHKRTQVVNDIATVLDKDVSTLTIKNIIGLLEGQDKEQLALSKVHDKLKKTLDDMVVVNEINKELIQDSLELIEFNINYINGINQLPETANYSKMASNVNGPAISTFDAKQ